MQRFVRLALAVSSAVVACSVMPVAARAQGLTTGGIGGLVTDGSGAPVEGANVRIVSPSTGATRLVQTRANGRYTATGLEIGTYRVSVAAIGFGPKAIDGVRVQLAQTARADFTLDRQAVTLQEIVTVATAGSSDFGPTRTGAQTYVSDSMVARLPTLNRQLQDFVKLTPQVTTNPDPFNSGELSVAGQNNRFNAIQVDGTTQNDRFGLGSTGELGGQANGRGISLEAVKEYQIVLSPYNVTQGGFTGGLVNAVTKNGTNDLRGTAFYTLRNQDLAPNVPFYAGSQFSIKQYGASLGGPLIKDKLHFFFAGELQSSLRPATGPYIGSPVTGGNAVRVDQALVDRFNAALAQYGIDGGSAGQVDNENPITNLVGRIDWRASDKHRVVLRGIYNNSKGDDFSRSNTNFFLTSNRFKRDEVASSFTAQLFSNIGSATNEFQIGVIRQRFKRAFDDPSPQITIMDVESPTVAGATFNLIAGSDSNSHINQLDQDFLEIRNDFTFPVAGNHLVTIGTRSDLYKVRNAFWQNAFGSWRFESIEDLEAGNAFAYAFGAAVGDDPIARFKAANLAFYAQDQWTVRPNFTLTYGVRFEGPKFSDKPGYLAEAERDLGRRTDEMPSNMTINPRLGFNWEASPVMQIRGGVGLFAGTPPYVWMSNLYTSNGRSGIVQFNCDGQSGRPAAPAFTPGAVENAPQVCAGGVGPGAGSTIGTINTVDPDYKQTQILRATLGLDRKIGWGVTATFDATYTYGLNSPMMVNLALADPVGTDANGRVMYGTLNPTTNVPSTVFRTPNIYGGGVYDLQNSKGDYAYGITGGLRKSFAGSFEASIAYSYQRSYSVQDFTSSTARSNYLNGRVTSTNQFDERVDPSAFERPHRVVASMTYTAPWKSYPTDISLIYQGQSGTNFTYTYSGSSNRGDMNADGVNSNDPIYIAATGAEMSFATIAASGGNPAITPAQQAAAWDQFLAAMPCLASQKGKIMSRSSCRNPWFNSLDLSVKQSLPSIKGHTLSLQADVYNFLNFLNGDWGVYRQNNRFPQVQLLTVTARSGNQPTVQFNPANTNLDFRFPKRDNAASNWLAQVTLRYSY